MEKERTSPDNSTHRATRGEYDGYVAPTETTLGRGNEFTPSIAQGMYEHAKFKREQQIADIKTVVLQVLASSEFEERIVDIIRREVEGNKNELSRLIS